MLAYFKKKSISLKSFVIFGFLFLMLSKIILIKSTYSYAFQQLDFWQNIYYFFLLIKEDLLVLGISLFFVYFISKIKNGIIKCILFFFIVVLFSLYLTDMLVIFFFQQRLLLNSGSSFLSAGSGILLFYVLIFILFIGFFSLFVCLFLKITGITIGNKGVITFLIISIFIYALPLPKFHFLGTNLPTGNIFSNLIEQSYTVSISSKKSKTAEAPSPSKEKIDVPDEEMQFLLKKKERWYGLAHNDPERVFESFQNSSLTRLTDEYGDDYVFEVLAEACKNDPELAFKYLDNYKDWKDSNGKTIVKDLLHIAIQYQPELAFTYLNKYENVVENHEKIAKGLLQYAAQIYKSPLTFDQLFSEVQGRANKSNVILVFLESASSVDSWKFGELNDRLPSIDKISNDGTSFLNLHANGMTSDMGHIATLLGVEPLEFDHKGTRYDTFTGYTTPLANFFNNLGYTTTFLSTASLDFLNQRDFLKNNGYQNIVGEEAFSTRTKYTFDAAPDADLYDKALEIIDNQTGNFFLTLQTISSHTPYNTPYGHTMDSMYRYEDDTFSEFYEQLKQKNFFDNGILIVIGDHRKMTPLEDDEFEKRGTTAASKIIGFIIGKNIPSNKLINGIYQQTDLFYSLIREFGSGTVSVLSQYNDLFSKNISRKRSLKQWYEDRKMNISDIDGHEGVLDLNRMKITDGAEFFPTNDIINYVKLSLDYQKNIDGEQDKDNNNRIILIAHRGITKNATENSLNAFKAAYNLGADGIELDVNATKDGKLVVYHGPKLYNQTQCQGELRDICEMDWNEVKSCLLKDGEEIMKLEDLLPEIKNWFTYIFLDFKAGSGENCNLNKEDLFNETVTLVQKNKMDAKVIFSSYDETISSLLSKKGNLISALDTYSLADLDKIPGSYFSYFMTPAENYSSTLVQKLQRYMVDAVAYTVNDITTVQTLQKIGVRFVMTDEFEKLKNALK